MPSKFLPYYGSVADRMMPYFADRRAVIEQRFPRSEKIVFRRHTGRSGDDTWIRIDDRAALLGWVRKYAEGFHGHLRSESGGAWFVIDIDSRTLSTDMARLAAAHASEALSVQGLEALITFSGSDGYHLMWEVPDLEDIGDEALWAMERAVVRAVACEVERRFAADPAAKPIRLAVGAGRPLIATSSADRDNPNALLFDEYILKANANFRLPYSVHPATGLVAAPIPLARLANFRPDDATPEQVARGWPEVAMPTYPLAAVRKALTAWADDGC